MRATQLPASLARRTTTRLVSGRSCAALIRHRCPIRAHNASRVSPPLPTARVMSSSADPGVSGLRDILRVSDEVKDAVANNKPVVALESTIYTHGFLGNDLAGEHDQLVRSCGGVPAIIAILDGVPTVGATPQDIIRMIESDGTVKASRRDLSYLAGMGLAGRKIHGGTTIAGTMVLARLAGIRVFGTGGLGGVHRGGENSMDVSADLTELGRTRVAVVASGCKGFLDIPRTLEFLETQGCLVSTFADSRPGKVDFPAFWARDSGIQSPSTVYTEQEAAAMIYAQEKLDMESGMLFANPIPEAVAIPSAEMRDAIEEAVAEANEQGFTGSNNTPFILRRLRELLGDKVVDVNKTLVQENIIRATNVAVELSNLLSLNSQPAKSSDVMKPKTKTKIAPTSSADVPADILVAGSVAVDLSCDYNSIKAGQLSPQLHTSNPAFISQSIGGVGHNVALAAHSVSREVRVKFYSMVGDDVAGSTVLTALQSAGMDTAFVHKLDAMKYPDSRTAQYVAVNDGEKNLVLAMADMEIFTQHAEPGDWEAVLKTTKPTWLVVDGNWSPKDIRAWLSAGKALGCKVAFEPVSVEKSTGLFPPPKGNPALNMFPHATVDLASPNTFELAAMHSAARENGYLDSAEWFEIINTFGMTGARDKFVRLTSAELTDAGVPVQSVQLLPFIPTLITKLGANGVLLTMLLHRDDPILRDRDAEEFILARSMTDHPTVGGVYMRLFPAAEKVDKIVSVNGVGDTFLGVLISGLAQGGRVENLINIAQKGAVLSLKHQGSVSPDISLLEKELATAASLR